ncbi:hypothetical protein [Frankia sp. R82]|uniref:hypothetical protein n=1 Tax=Frankia sp. R82 TaxID=2950553 RepID=UPI0020449B9A|nr:hypothetical protein [Frankia sp. R82]MCM3884138.1 hypothetical protein [Frankia sp. R82]
MASATKVAGGPITTGARSVPLTRSDYEQAVAAMADDQVACWHTGTPLEGYDGWEGFKCRLRPGHRGPHRAVPIKHDHHPGGIVSEWDAVRYPHITVHPVDLPDGGQGVEVRDAGVGKVLIHGLIVAAGEGYAVRWQGRTGQLGSEKFYSRSSLEVREQIAIAYGGEAR